ncbi:MAG: hypothetical protein KAV25_09270 [Methanophagales archaeon]|nr:hypothetical protein [Methanophagales archaeon]
MPNREDKLSKGKFQTKIDEAGEDKDVWKIVKEVLREIICLKITTKVTGTGSAEGEEICTMIDLLQADRTNEIHRNFLKDPAFAPLRDFHAEQVKLAEQDIQKKLEFLENLARVLINAINGAKE